MKQKIVENETKQNINERIASGKSLKIETTYPSEFHYCFCLCQIEPIYRHEILN